MAGGHVFDDQHWRLVCVVVRTATTRSIFHSNARTSVRMGEWRWRGRPSPAVPLLRRPLPEPEPERTSDLLMFRIVALNTEDPPEEFHGVFVGRARRRVGGFAAEDSKAGLGPKKLATADLVHPSRGVGGPLEPKAVPEVRSKPSARRPFDFASGARDDACSAGRRRKAAF